MAIVISGVNNNDKITASDGTIDLLSGVNYVGVLTAPSISASGNITAGHLNIGSGIQLGNAGIISATTLIGNVTGNVNHNSNLLLQISGSEKLRIANSGAFGLNGTNYGSSGQVLTSQGSGSSPVWSTINSDAINEGNTKAEVIDSGSDGRFIVETEGTQRIRIDSNGLGITSTTTAARNAGVGTAIGTIIFNSTANQLQVYDNKLVWKGFSPLDPTLTNISGTIYAAQASTLTLAGTNFLTQNLQVRFVQATRSVDVSVTVTPTSNGTAASVDVPATVYNNIQGGDVVSIIVTNSDNNSSNTINLTTSALPTGGTITNSGSYRIHTFTSGGNFVVPAGLTLNNVEYLVVGGGGGGGPSNNGHQGGGGGAGGLRTSVVGATSGRGTSAEARVTYTAGTYGVSVGAGGASKSQSGGGYGSSGVQSYLTLTGGGYITSAGGGGGGRGQNDGASRGGLNGGCGGGAASSDQSPAVGGSGTAGQGYDGGAPTCTGCGRGAGGGGAGGAGTNGGSGGVGNSNTPGGVGLSNNITGSSVTYATGGDCPGTGCDQNPGAANTGNGGDSGYSNGCSTTGQAGGSGIVIVRYVV